MHWGGGSCTATYPIPHPPKQIKCLIQTRPLPAPQLQPLSRPQGTMPAVIRRQHCWSNTVTHVQLPYSDCWWTDGSFSSHAHVWCRRHAKCLSLQKWTKGFSWLCLIIWEVDTKEVSLKQQSVNIILKHSPSNTGINEGLEFLSWPQYST